MSGGTDNTEDFGAGFDDVSAGADSGKQGGNGAEVVADHDDETPIEGQQPEDQPNEDEAGEEGGEAAPERDHRDQELATLRGKYNAEVPRLNDENKSLKARIAELERQSAAAPPQPEDEPEEWQAVVESAPSIAEGVRKYVGAILSREFAAVRAQAQPALDVEQIVAAASARATHFATIQARHPDFQQVVPSKAFQAYVGALPTAEKAKAQATLQRGTAAEVVGLIGSYKQAKGLGDPFDSDVVRSRGPRVGMRPGGGDDASDFDAGFNGKK